MREIRVSDHLLRRLEREEKARNNRITGGLAILLASILLASLINLAVFFIGLALFVLLASLGSRNGEREALQIGIEGEEILRNGLREILSDEYIAFFNIPLRRGDIDCFVIGPTGAYLFDVKNHNGYVLYANGSWSQTKVGRRGKVYSGENMKNPSSQVRTGLFEMKKFLSKNGVKLWIEGVIVFTNPDVELFCENPDGLKIIRPGEIESVFRGKRPWFTPKAVEAIANLILEGYGEKKEALNGGFHS
jgi:hypothetical protein